MLAKSVVVRKGHVWLHVQTHQTLQPIRAQSDLVFEDGVMSGARRALEACVGLQKKVPLRFGGDAAVQHGSIAWITGFMRLAGFHGVETRVVPFPHHDNRDFRFGGVGWVDGLDSFINLGGFLLEDPLELPLGNAVAVDDDVGGEGGGVVGLIAAETFD